MRPLLYLLLLALVACTPTRTAAPDDDTVASNDDKGRLQRVMKSDRGSNSVEVNTAESGADLTSYLRRIAGVSVRGDGPAATVRIRGDMNFNADATPLFVVDGTILGSNFSSVYSTIDVNEIARVRVLKNVSDTNRYGMQGANGVIEIKLRK